jgi:hypothetical protein
VGNDVRETMLSEASRFPGHFLVPSRLRQQEEGSRGVYQGLAPPSGVSVFPPSSSHPQNLTIYLKSSLLHNARPHSAAALHQETSYRALWRSTTMNTAGWTMPAHTNATRRFRNDKGYPIYIYVNPCTKST